jgi:hypothetical protein
MSDQESESVKKIPKERQRPPFVPMTGNPENGDYADWYHHLKEGEVVPFPKK